MSDRILIVDDEPDVVDNLVWTLTREGYRTLVARTGAEAIDLARAERPALILLDLMLPDVSGNEVCRELVSVPETRHIPIVMLSAHTDEIDRIVGFELGSTDFIAKPYSPRELVLRVRAILRRTRPQPAPHTQRLTLGPITIDREAHRVLVDGEDAQFTARELCLLCALVARQGRVLTREQLLAAVWPDEAEVLDRAVDAMIMRIRHKLGHAADKVATVRGVGYVCHADEDEAQAVSG